MTRIQRPVRSQLQAGIRWLGCLLCAASLIGCSSGDKQLASAMAGEVLSVERDLLKARRALVVPATPQAQGTDPAPDPSKVRPELSRIAADSLAEQLRLEGVERAIISGVNEGQARPLDAVFVVDEGDDPAMLRDRHQTDSVFYLVVAVDEAAEGGGRTLTRTTWFQSGQAPIQFSNTAGPVRYELKGPDAEAAAAFERGTAKILGPFE